MAGGPYIITRILTNSIFIPNSLPRVLGTRHIAAPVLVSMLVMTASHCCYRNRHRKSGKFTISGLLGNFRSVQGRGQYSYTGPDPATSKRNFDRWVHGLISTIVPTKCLTVDGTPGDVVGIMSAFTPFSQWTTDLEAPGDPGSLGEIIQYNEAGERCKATVGNIGPFGN